MFRQVTAIVLIVEDFDKCLAFYRDTLGLQVVLLEPTTAAFKMHEQDFALVHVSEAADMLNVSVNSFEAQSGKVDRVMLCTRVDNVDAVYETLKARGVVFTKPPVNQPWGIRAVYFFDPEGNVWEFASPLATQ
ncbi:MAG: VOC family protein [Anaerolineae bacterium]|nr:MAG: VOC family protein [Anaerolineae bacterium]